MSAPPTKRLAAPGAPEPLRAQQPTAAAGAPATAASSCTRPLAQAADFDGGAPKKSVAGMVAGRIVRVAASGADSIDGVQTLSIRLPNGDLRSWQVPRGTPVESITEELEKELPPYHEAKLFARDEILCGGTIADEVEGGVTLVKVPSITKAVAALERLHSEWSHCTFLPRPQFQELLQALRFFAQYEGSLEQAHARMLFATVYDMYVDDWEVDASGADAWVASAASGALSALVSRGPQQNNDSSLTAAASAAPSAAASGAPLFIRDFSEESHSEPIAAVVATY